MNLPNKLTVARIILAPLFLLIMLADFPFHYGVALIVFIVAALTDMYDGRIARGRGLITNLGKFLDPLADKMLTTAAFLGFMVRLGGDYLCWMVMLILTREFMVTSVRLLAAKDGVVVAASMAGKLKTVAQFVAIIYTLAAMQVCSFSFAGRALNFALLIPAYIFIGISTLLTVISGIQYVWNLRHYFTE